MTSGFQLFYSGLQNQVQTLKNYAIVTFRQPRLAVGAFHHLKQRVLPLLRSRLAVDRSVPASKTPIGPQTLDQLLRHLGQQMGVLVLDRSDTSATIGVADINFLRALEEIVVQAPLGLLQAGGHRLAPNSLASRRVALKSSAVVFSFLDRFGSPSSLVIECYVRHSDGKWLSNNARNQMARAIYQDVLLNPALCPIDKIVPMSSRARSEPSRPVDVVYTWVDHNDRSWTEAYKNARHEESFTQQNLDGRGALFSGTKAGDATAISRFHMNEELRYSLRSLAFNFTGTGRIFILSNCAAPAWLDTSHPRISWVDHREVIPSQYLPTFSSHVIESFLHHIPDMNNNFIYMNDDFFIASRMNQDSFFDEAGRSRTFLEPYGMVSGSLNPQDPDYLNASRNSSMLLLEAFKAYPTRLHAHTPYALRKDVLSEIEGRWPSVFETLRSSRFRSIQDVNLTSFLYHHYALLTDRACAAAIDTALVNQVDFRWRDLLHRARTADVQTICINEGGTTDAGEDWYEQVRQFMSYRFPIRASWER